MYQKIFNQKVYFLPDQQWKITTQREMRLLRDRKNYLNKLNSNDVVLFHAAAGGVGQVFSQWAKAIGCKLIGTVGSDEKIHIAKKNGCDYVINYTKQNFAKEIKDITKGVGVSVVYDGVGKNTFQGSIECLKPRGTMVSFGNASGPLDPLNVPKDIQSKSLFFTRPTMKDYYETRNEVVEGWPRSSGNW